MKRLLTSCFGLGLLPVAPGTWGSLPPVVIFALLYSAGASAITTSIVMLILVAAGSLVCIIYTPAIIEATGKTDPSEVVADEFAGQALTLSIVPFLLPPQIQLPGVIFISLLGFAAFRIFDITKPLGIRKLEKLPAGWGVLLDDLLAGIYAAVLIIVTSKLWMSCLAVLFRSD